MGITITQLDAVQELVNVGVGHAASIFNEMLGAHIHLQVPHVQVLSIAEANQELGLQIGDTYISAMQLRFTGSLDGTALLIFPLDSAAQLVTVLMGEETDLPDLDAVKRGTLCEVGNILLNSVMGEISNALSQSLRYSMPYYFERNVRDILNPSELIKTSTILLAQTHLICNPMQITGDFILIFTMCSFSNFLLALDLV